MGPKEIYLILYNLGACAGWSLVLALAVQSLSKGIPEDGLLESLANVYGADNLATLLTYSQTAALLEILHAAVGLVRSPVLITAMQVGSRIVALVAIIYSPQAQSEFCDVL
jgi:very-long-chain (3R)-3-hydroxyacyl-CoA dehydratase